MIRRDTRRRDEVQPVDPVKAILNWRKRGLLDREIVEAVRWERISSKKRHPVTHAGCVAILERLGAR